MISISVKEKEIILSLSKRVNLIERISYANGGRVDSTPWCLSIEQGPINIDIGDARFVGYPLEM